MTIFPQLVFFYDDYEEHCLRALSTASKTLKQYKLTTRNQ